VKKKFTPTTSKPVLFISYLYLAIDEKSKILEKLDKEIDTLKHSLLIRPSPSVSQIADMEDQYVQT
jgi:hypothetical protein